MNISSSCWVQQQNRSCGTVNRPYANIEARDVNNQTPLHYATCTSRKEFKQLVIIHKAGIESKDVSNQAPLHRAAHSNSAVAQLLITHKGNVEAKEGSDGRPVDVARNSWTNTEIMTCLLIEQAARTS